MGVDFRAKLFFGMPLSDAAGIDLYDVFDGSVGPLESMDTSPMTSDGIQMLFVRESYNVADEYSDEVLLRLDSLTGKEAEWRQFIIDACAEHGLTFVEPGWYFASTFS